MNYSFQGRHISMQLAAMVASHDQNLIHHPASHQSTAFASPLWLADSECNADVASDFNHLQAPVEYSGDDNVGVGGGQSLPIAHTCCGLLQTHNSSFKLSNLYHVPQISSNLLSVHRLCVDNNFRVIFKKIYIV